MDVAQYPQYLIPQTVWREHMCVDEMLSEMDDFCVLRRIDCSEEEGIDYSLVEGGGRPFLTHKALSDSSIANMSMSLLGTPFQKDDIKFKQHEEAMADWQGGEVDAKRLIENFVDVVPEPWFEVVWYVRGFHKKEVPYKKGVKGDEEFNKLKNDVKAVRNIVLTTLADYNAEETPLYGLIVLNHRPTNLNYWHYTLDLLPADREGYIEEPQNSSEKKLLKKVGNQYLRYSFRRYEPTDTIPMVKESLWIK